MGQEYHPIWDRNFKAYMGSYFEEKMPEYKSQEISNYVFSTIETVKPIMMLNNPRFLAMPNREVDYDKSIMVQHAIDYEWQRTKMFTQLLKALTTGLIFGSVPIALVWDAKASNGLGQIKPIIMSPFNVFADPLATCVDDAEYIMYACYKNVGEVIKAYPEKADLLMASTQAVTDEYLAYGKNTTNLKSDKAILYIEAFMRDYSTETEVIEENGEKVQQTMMKYPGGKSIVIAGDVLLSDDPNPYQDGKFPYTVWKCYDIPGKFWGESEVSQIVSPQKYRNEVINQILDSAKLTANSPWIVDKNAGVEKNSLTNRQGLVIRKNPGTDIHREQPAGLPAYISNIPDMLGRDIEQISGVYDVTRGERPTGITAAAAIQALNEQAQGRVRLKVQAMEQMLGELGSMWTSRMQQFWVTKRTIRIMGEQYTPNSNIDKAIGMGMQNPMAQGMSGAIDMMAKAQPDPYKPQFALVDKDDIDGDFDISVVGGSTMQQNKTAKLQMLIQLAQTQAEDGLPVIDRQTILENADVGNVKEILQRFQQLKQQQMEMQQQQMMQQMALQNQNPNIQSESEGNNSQQQAQPQDGQPDSLQQIISMISKMSPDEIAQLIKENPDVVPILEQIANQPNNQQ
jgi:hypothetical protein